ncbi:MAG: ABC transporter substrate-binding protein [Deltaproteobacteria bacterium]
MKKTVCLAMLFGFLITFCGLAQAAGSLQDIIKKGVLRAGVKDLTPGFALENVKTGEISGYDVDIVKAIARKLNVKLDIIPVGDKDRISRLKEGAVDILAATLTKTPARAKAIDFSYTYFVTGQKFLVKKGTVRKLTDLKDKKIGTVAGTTSEANVRKALPKATIALFSDHVPAFLALQRGEIAAITTDEAILVPILAKADPGLYEIPDITISKEPYGLGIRKGDKSLRNFVNKTLLEMEKSGEAKRIYDKWFGPASQTPMKRAFKITTK